MSAALMESDSQQQPTLSFDWCELTKLGLRLKAGRTFKYEEWEQLQEPLTVAEKGAQFGLGDWLVLGEAKYGEKASQALDGSDKTGVKPKTLTEYRRVSQKVPLSIRMETLEWSHHQIVASVKGKAARARWLQLAEKEDLTVAQLRRAIREAEHPANAKADPNYLDPHYKQFLLDYIATQHAFLNKCPYEPFKKEIQHTLKAAMFQKNRTETSDFESVQEQVDQGACTPEEIAEEVFLETDQIKKILPKIIGCEMPSKSDDPREAGTPYEWRPIGVNTEMAKGSRAYGIFRKDAPSGDDFDLPSTYHPNVEWESEAD